MAKNLDFIPELAYCRRQYGVWDDFLWMISPHMWTTLEADDNATVAIATGSNVEGGVVQLLPTTDDEEEAGIFTTNEMFIFAADRPIHAYGRIQYSEANTDDANVAFGLADAAGANLLSDAGGGDNIGNSGALIFKVDGETVWRCASENNGTVIENQSNTTAGGSSYQELEIRVSAVDARFVEITYFVDNVQLTDSTTNAPILHRLAYASATQMDFGAYCKQGSTNSETVNIDALGCWQRRA